MKFLWKDCFQQVKTLRERASSSCGNKSAVPEPPAEVDTSLQLLYSSCSSHPSEVDRRQLLIHTCVTMQICT